MSLDDEWEQSGLVGKLVAGRYLIVNPLGSDQRRTLYEAESVEEGVRVTLAVVRAEGKDTEQRLRDGKALRSLEHRGLARVLDVGKLDSGELFLATERVEGTTLRAATRGKPLGQRRALLIMRQVLEALAAAHSVGAIHGNVTPENIILMPGLGEDRVKLVDLGIATLVGATRAGDPVYSAPESSLGAIDARADIYSVGAVLFELLTGHAPFFAEDANGLRRLHAYAPVQTLKQRAPDGSFADSLETIVATALAKSRDDRFQSASEMVTALDPPLQAIEEAAPPPPASERREELDASLLLLANDLMPRGPSSEHAQEDLVVAPNVGREVPHLSWATRAQLFSRRVLARARPLRIAKRSLVVLAAVVALGLVAAVVTCGARRSAPDLGRRAKALLDQGRKGEAIQLVEREIAAHPDKVNNFVVLGDTQLALFHHQLALAAYEKALTLKPALATDSAMLANLSRIVGSDDTQTAIAALDLIAVRSGTTGRAVIVSHASTNPHADVRHHASTLAENVGGAVQIDHVTSWSLDLDQAGSCDERRDLIKKLAKTGDHRALPALERARAHACVERDAVSAIERIKG